MKIFQLVGVISQKLIPQQKLRASTVLIEDGLTFKVIQEKYLLVVS